MAIVFATKKEALEFLRGLKDYFEHDSGGVFSPRQYCRRNGEYSSPDYKPCHYKDGWGIKGIYYYYPGTFYAPRDGRCDIEDVSEVWDDAPVYALRPEVTD